MALASCSLFGQQFLVRRTAQFPHGEETPRTKCAATRHQMVQDQRSARSGADVITVDSGRQPLAAGCHWPPPKGGRSRRTAQRCSCSGRRSATAPKHGNDTAWRSLTSLTVKPLPREMALPHEQRHQQAPGRPAGREQCCRATAETCTMWATLATAAAGDRERGALQRISFGRSPTLVVSKAVHGQSDDSRLPSTPLAPSSWTLRYRPVG